MLNLDLKGKRALVCGSTQGIGKAIASELADCGASIILFARNEEKLIATLEGLPARSGQEHGFIQADFNHSKEVEKAMNAEIKNGSTFHILINNTGGPPGGLAKDAEPDEFREAFERHLIASQILVKALLPGMVKAEYGRIVNIISTSVKAPIAGLGVSNTIRGAMANWAKTLSKELGPFGITVNNILPGATNTGRLTSLIDKMASSRGVEKAVIQEEMYAEIPVGRFADPWEIAAAAVFLCTSAAGYINGINLPVDGGRLGSL